MSRWRFALAALVFSACDGEKTPAPPAHGGTVVIAATGNFGSLFPPNVSSTTGRQITELVYDYLAEVGLSLNTIDDKTFAHRLAASWDWSSDSMSLAAHLDPRARWHDGQPVRSSDVTYSYGIYSDTSFSPIASQLANIDSVTARDSLTAVFWFSRRYPLQFYDAMSQMQILPRHIYGSIPIDSLNDSVARIEPVGTGRYRFAKQDAEQSIELAADTMNFRGAPNIQRLIFRRFGSADEAVRALGAGEADIYDVMRPGDVQSAARDTSLRILTSPGSDYAFLVFNTKRSMFSDRNLRRALTMAVDIESMVKNVFDTLAIPGVGPTLSYFPSTSKSLRRIQFSPAEAGKLLDSIGWRMNPSTGVRSKSGKELRFKTIIPSSSSNRVKMGTLLQEQFRKVGVAFEPEQMEFGTFNSKLLGRDFDAALASWHLGTSPASIRILWTTGAPQNLGSYSNPQFDAFVDSAIATSDMDVKSSFYNRAYQTAIDDAPAIWLYEPKVVIGIHKRIHTKPYRPDAWWWSLPDWFIPASEQIPRDRIP
jgi:peptide/nickel transport system substrate-binding protein